MPRRLVPGLLVPLALAACSARRPPLTPPLGAGPPAWKTLLDDFVVPPLATDGRRLFVASRDGAVRALDPATGAVAWKAAELTGCLSAAEGLVLVRAADGGLTSVHPRTGAVRWKAETGVEGTMPAVVDQDRALVAGRGLAAVDLASGRVLWADVTGSETTTPPVPAGSRLLAGEADGTLRCRDRATGLSLWSLATGGPLVAPPLVDLAERRAYVGTTDKRILEVSLNRGSPGWSWRVGADVAHPGLLLPGRVLFAPADAVLYALHRGGKLAWRAALPSRPLSGPLLLGRHVAVACLEDEILAFALDTGAGAGRLRTAAEIRTPPVLAGGHLAVGLRDRSVVGYALAGAAPAGPAAPPPLDGPPPGR